MKMTKVHLITLNTIRNFAPPEVFIQDLMICIERLVSISKSLRKSYEFSCNYPQTEQQEARREARESRLENEAIELGESIGAMTYIQTDPRGNAVYLIFPGMIPATAKEYFEADSEQWLRQHYNIGIAV